MAQRPGFRQSDLARAIKGATAAGCRPCGCRINPATGEIELTFAGEAGASAGNSFDAIMGGRR